MRVRPAVVYALAAVLAAAPACNKEKRADPRESADNLYQIARAFHAYHDRHGQLPSPVGLPRTAPPNAKLLSWRVHLLPYLEQDALYREFKLDEPWDSPHNRPLVDKMPEVYKGMYLNAGPGKTGCKVFVGGGALFNRDPRWTRSIATIPDGSSNTIMVAEGGPAVTWTAPEDFAFDPNGPLPDLALPDGGRRIYVALADGAVRRIDLDEVSPLTLKRAIQADDGMVLGSDW